MFNALNRFISRLDGDAPSSASAKENQHGAFGFQVLRNESLQLAVEPWFDFVVGINGRMIDDSDPRLFAQEVRNCAGGAVMLGLWSAKGQRTRALHVAVPVDTGSLGLTLQWTPLAVVSNIWHVLDVPAGSPADAAGLLPYSDYILGTPEGVLHGEGGLSELVEDHIGRPLRLYVYNNEYNVTREVTIQPSRDWGGQGALGCVLGYGALHRLPAPLSEPVHLPGETLFDGADSVDAAATAAGAPAGQFVAPDAPSTFSAGGSVPPPPPPFSSGGDFIVPANLVGSTSPPPPSGAAAFGGPPRSSRKKDRHAHQSPNLLMDDYFKEQEKKSRELDNVPSRQASPLPPPPKTGGPPRAGPPPRGGNVNTPPPPPAASDGGED
ncbi:GRASP55/65 PDZ-like domain-containing protein [Lasiosphaeria ovina]|uniref:GRASP55/65 PDZ-like domain-containing protein n=1 Tax=Lasiosphaeria ovina TaxID=92902 RepID=A0AAE0NLW5_9PEZI|nr:GRASP55/65 PDZ-like domain-containing protein [Lasiosphaeria ovina]